MTDFNALPLAEQLNALEPGDELHLRGGGWLPFLQYKGQMNICTAHYVWYLEDADTDIIRVIRPSARKVPDDGRLIPEFYATLRQQIIDFENAVPFDYDESLRYIAFLFRKYVEKQHGIHEGDEGDEGNEARK